MIEKEILPSNKNFGVVFFLFFFLTALYLIALKGDIRIWSALIALIFINLGLINSKILNSLNKIWHKLGIFLGKIISLLILGIIFFFIVTPKRY